MITPNPYTDREVFWKITHSPLSLSTWGTLFGGATRFFFAFKAEKRVLQLQRTIGNECS
ncbi:MAG: hypothetical protein LLG04_11360 [Parachlamydia sp.]|nr:hypothetical protein [Parachlamydia sp.]